MEDKKQNNDRQVLVIQDGDGEVKPSKWTWGRYGKSIVKYKYWNIGSTLAVALIGFLGINFMYNPGKMSFTSSFSYDLPMTIDEKTGNGNYANGETFNFHDIISSENLSAVKTSNSKFGGVNIVSALDNDEISISVNGTTNQNGDFIVSLPVTYTISGKLNNFGDQATATEFFKAVVETVQNKANGAIKNYTISNLFPNDYVYANLDFEDQIESLSNQYNQILSVYERLTSYNNAGSDYIETDTSGKTLKSVISDYELSYKQGAGTKFSALTGSLQSKNYVNFDTDKVQDKIDELTQLGELDIESLRNTLENLAVYQTALENIKSNFTGDSSAAAQAAEYNRKILELSLSTNNYVKELKTLGYDVPDDVKLDNIDTIKLSTTKEGKIQKLTQTKNGTDGGWADECKTFKESIMSVKAQLLSDTEKGSTIYKFVNNKYRNSVSYVNPGIIVVSGALSPWIGIVAGALIGFLVSSLICGGVYVSKLDKEEKENKGGAETK